ncbi:MAG: hypothetical protein BAJATHORv1_30139 [Candidatus Thorarchaeota archaeon]|nr:MAG: hypothetical protein BAJATHORv1_30139 [Candidatus Thorarchaeota archaeon]
MVRGYEVSEDGTLQEVEMDKDSLDSTKVVCVVDDETKSIYLWKGSQAGVRKKFIGARVATNLRTEYGFHFKVRPLDEGEEPPTFFTALDGTTAATPVLKPGDPTPPESIAPPKPKPKPKPKEKETTSTPPPKPKPKPASTTTSSASTAPPVPKSTGSTAAPKTAATTSAPAVSSTEIQSMIKELEETEPPEGYRRELLIVYNELFTVAEHTISVFGQTKIEHKFEKVKDPPEGTFMAEGFVPRVIVKDGRVLGIELLKGTPDAILSPIKQEMKERLGDLITFFRSEVDEGTIEEEEKGKSDKKKLVAK